MLFHSIPFHRFISGNEAHIQKPDDTNIRHEDVVCSCLKLWFVHCQWKTCHISTSTKTWTVVCTQCYCLYVCAVLMRPVIGCHNSMNYRHHQPTCMHLKKHYSHLKQFAKSASLLTASECNICYCYVWQIKFWYFCAMSFRRGSS